MRLVTDSTLEDSGANPAASSNDAQGLVRDCGRIINPKLVEGQVQEGIAQDVGQALTEGILYSPEGQPLTSSLIVYALPFAARSAGS